MRIVKHNITTRLALLYLILSVFSGCSDATEYSQGPCPFPPAESNFPVFPEPSVLCKECTFTIEFQGEVYSFDGNQLETRSIGLGEAHNSFFSFYLAPPPTVKELYESIAKKTPLLTSNDFFF